MNVAELVADAKQLVAKLFLDADKPTHAIGRRQLVADLRASGIPTQIANRAIEDLKSAGLLLTPREVCANIEKENEGRVNGKGEPIVITKEQRPLISGAWRAGDDGLIASRQFLDEVSGDGKSRKTQPRKQSTREANAELRRKQVKRLAKEYGQDASKINSELSALQHNGKLPRDIPIGVDVIEKDFIRM